MELELIDDAGRWTLTGPAGERWRIGSAGLRLTCPALTVAHGAGGRAEYYRHGWSSWAPTAWWRIDRDPWRVWDRPSRTATAEDTATDTAAAHRSYLLTAVVLDGGPGDRPGDGPGLDPGDGGAPEDPDILLVGTLGGSTGVLDVDGRVIRARHLDAVTAPKAPTHLVPSTAWWVGAGPETEVMRAWAAALGESVGGRRPAPAEGVGPVWSSWYSWYEEITSAIIREEIPAAARCGYSVLQIDDGWERAVGHWEANDDFPEGMAAVAEEIRAAGLVPGLWLAPLIAVDGSPVVRDRPELFIHDDEGGLVEAGFNWGQCYRALDCTSPEALDWIHEQVSRAVSWGFGYLKLDFLNAAAVVGHRRGGASREEAYRAGLLAARRAAPEAYLMASGGIPAPSLGVVDGIRVGPDTAPYWDNAERHRDPSGCGARNALRNSIARAWLRTLVDADPDVAYARTRGSLLSPEANAVTQDLARVMGVLGCSDPASWLTAEEASIVASLCAAFDGRRPEAEQLGRSVFRVDGRRVDFGPWISPRGRISDRLLAK